MKLYATTTSERASKGQGGNDYLKIKVQDEGKNEIVILDLKYHNGKALLRFWDNTMSGEGFHSELELKGKSQKGEN